jgi:hypothetical protein
MRDEDFVEELHYIKLKWLFCGIAVTLFLGIPILFGFIF